MKKNIIYLSLVLSSIAVSSCNLDVLSDPKAISVDQSLTPDGAFKSTVSAVKAGFDNHQNFGFVSGFVGNEELQTLSAATSFPTANIVEQKGKLTEDNDLNASLAASAYTALAFADNARNGVTKSVSNTTAQALLLANINMIEGVVYGNWSKYFNEVPEFGTGTKLTWQQGRDKAIGKLQEAIKQFNALGTNSLDNIGLTTTTGLYSNAAQGVKFCNGFIALLYYDTGDKAKAGDFLKNSYVKADAGKELSYKILNTTSGDGLYPAQRSAVEFARNKYSDKFLLARVTADTMRRAPAKWYIPYTGTTATDQLRTLFNYFFPQAPGTGVNPAGSPTQATYPVTTWAEIALMQADPAVNQADTKTVIKDVLLSWNISDKNATTMVADATVTLDRVARYEYIGRGRRWAATNFTNKWDLSVNFKFN